VTECAVVWHVAPVHIEHVEIILHKEAMTFFACQVNLKRPTTPQHILSINYLIQRFRKQDKMGGWASMHHIMFCLNGSLI
jgi:hypothetical protein